MNEWMGTTVQASFLMVNGLQASLLLFHDFDVDRF